MTPQTLNLGPDRSLFTLSAGSGPAIILLHGAFTTHVDWLGGPFEAFAALGRAMLVDRPGHGASRRPRFEASPAAQAAQIRQGLDALGVQRPLVVGHSMGGMTALAYAAAYPEALSGLLLLSPIVWPEVRPLEQMLLGPRSAPLAGPLLSEAWRWTFDPALLGLVQRVMFWPESTPQDWLARYPYKQILSPSQMVAEGEDALGVSPLSPGAWTDLSRVTAPLHIIAGENDKVADPNRHSRRLHALMPESRLTMIDGAGHMVHHHHLDAVLAAAQGLCSTALQPQEA